MTQSRKGLEEAGVCGEPSSSEEELPPHPQSRVASLAPQASPECAEWPLSTGSPAFHCPWQGSDPGGEKFPCRVHELPCDKDKGTDIHCHQSPASRVHSSQGGLKRGSTPRWSSTIAQGLEVKALESGQTGFKSPAHHCPQASGW